MKDNDILEELKKDRNAWTERINELNNFLSEANRKVEHLDRLISLMEKLGMVWWAISISPDTITTMSRQHHYIKILPEYYRAVEQKKKTFEVRYNDRDYKVYDVLHLQEWLNGGYTGREITANVTYILNDSNYCKDGYVIMSIEVISINN